MQKKQIYFCSFFWENPIRHASNIHPVVFNGFYRTITHEEPHIIIYKEIIFLIGNPFFCIWTFEHTQIPQIPQFSQFQPSSVATIQNHHK